MFMINSKQNQIKSPFWIILCKKIMIYLNSVSNSVQNRYLKIFFLTLILIPIYLHFDSIKICVGGPLEWPALDGRTDGQNAKLIGSFFQNKLPKKTRWDGLENKRWFWNNIQYKFRWKEIKICKIYRIENLEETRVLLSEYIT